MTDHLRFCDAAHDHAPECRQWCVRCQAIVLPSELDDNERCPECVAAINLRWDGPYPKETT